MLFSTRFLLVIEHYTGSATTNAWQGPWRQGRARRSVASTRKTESVKPLNNNIIRLYMQYATYMIYSQSAPAPHRQSTHSTHLGRQTDNLAPPLHPQLRADHPAHTRAQHLALVVQQHRRVVVEPDHPPVGPPHRLPRSYYNGAAHVPAADLDGGGGGGSRGGDGPRGFDDADDFVADGAPAVVDLLLEDVDALDEDRA